jgi:hypothetical protein
MIIRLLVERRLNGDAPHSVAKGDHQGVGQIISVRTEEALRPKRLWISPNLWVGQYKSDPKVITELLTLMQW